MTTRGEEQVAGRAALARARRPTEAADLLGTARPLVGEDALIRRYASLMDLNAVLDTDRPVPRDTTRLHDSLMGLNAVLDTDRPGPSCGTAGSGLASDPDRLDVRRGAFGLRRS